MSGPCGTPLHPVNPEHFSSGSRESPSNTPNPDNRQKPRNLIPGQKVDLVTDTRVGKLKVASGSPLHLSRAAMGHGVP